MFSLACIARIIKIVCMLKHKFYGYSFNILHCNVLTKHSESCLFHSPALSCFFACFSFHFLGFLLPHTDHLSLSLWYAMWHYKRRSIVCFIYLYTCTRPGGLPFPVVSVCVCVGECVFVCVYMVLFVRGVRKFIAFRFFFRFCISFTLSITFVCVICFNIHTRRRVNFVFRRPNERARTQGK